MRKYYTDGVSKSVEWKENKSMIFYFFNDIKLFVETYDFEYNDYTSETVENKSLNKVISSGSNNDFIILLEMEKDIYRDFQNQLYLSDLVKSLKNKSFDLKIFIGKQSSYNFKNPLTLFSKLISDKKINLVKNTQTNTCLIEDPYLNDSIELINLIGDLINVENLIILKSVVDENIKITMEKIENKNVFFIPITRFFDKKNNKFNHRFHDRNIITNDYWINLGNSFRINNFYTQTQLFLNPNFINLEFIKYKIQGSVNLINQHCPQLKECKIDVFDFNRRFNLNDINFIFDEYIKLFDSILKKKYLLIFQSDKLK